jgi:carbon storage regulator
VLAVVGDKVRIGIEAPRSVPVYRKEVWLEIQREGARATDSTLIARPSTGRSSG